MDVETLAKELHEAGREAVLTNKVVKKDGNPIGQITFIEWDELKEEAKEGRRIQARYLLKRYDLSPRTLEAIYDMVVEEYEKRGIPKSILMGDKPGIVKDDNDEK